MKGYYEYFSVKQKALRRMDVLKLTNPYVDSIYLYDAEKDVVLRSGRVSVPFAEFEDKDWYEPFQNHHTFPVFMRERRTYHNPDQYEKSVITLIHSAWDNPVYKKIALIVNLNADLLYADLFDKMKDDAGASDRYVLFSSDYGLLLGKREDVRRSAGWWNRMETLRGI